MNIKNNRQEELLTGRGREDRRWQSWGVVSNRKQDKLQFHSHLMLMEHTFTSLKACNLKIPTERTYRTSLNILVYDMNELNFIRKRVTLQKH